MGIIIVGLIIAIFIWISWTELENTKIRNQVLEDFQKQINLQIKIDESKKNLKSKNYKHIRKPSGKDTNHEEPNLVGSFNDFLYNCICPNCGEGHPRERIGKYGEFIGCSNYPDCTYTEKIKSTKKEYKIIVKEQILKDIQKAYN